MGYIIGTGITTIWATHWVLHFETGKGRKEEDGNLRRFLRFFTNQDNAMLDDIVSSPGLGVEEVK